MSQRNDVNVLQPKMAATEVQHFACKRSYKQWGLLEVKVKK